MQAVISGNKEKNIAYCRHFLTVGLLRRFFPAGGQAERGGIGDAGTEAFRAFPEGKKK